MGVHPLAEGEGQQAGGRQDRPIGRVVEPQAPGVRPVQLAAVEVDQGGDVLRAGERGALVIGLVCGFRHRNEASI